MSDDTVLINRLIAIKTQLAELDVGLNKLMEKRAELAQTLEEGVNILLTSDSKDPMVQRIVKR